MLLEQELIFQHNIESKCAQCCGARAPSGDNEYKAEGMNVSLGGNSSPMSLPTVPELGVSVTGASCAYSGDQHCSHKQGSWQCRPRSEKVYSSESSDYPYTQLFHEGKAWDSA